uniref:HD domain-containing protein n=1 Tax=Streptomyces antimycoticus TaxID=68175 RepID=UPI002F90A993|nr:HD domain-containing protein [Streptomyces antimycoticus]
MKSIVFDGWHDWEAARAQLAVLAPSISLARLDAAVDMARSFHGDQKRPAGEPYMEHLLEALEILVSGAGVHDEDVLVAAVLHDIVEDTACTSNEVEARFGERVAGLVAWVTKPATGPDEHAAEVRDRYLLGLHSAPRDAVILKLADRLSNVQRLDTHPRPAKRRSYYRETCEHFLPLSEGVPWFEEAFGTWRESYRHLE